MRPINASVQYDVCTCCEIEIRPHHWFSLDLPPFQILFFCSFTCMWIFTHPHSPRKFEDASEKALLRAKMLRELADLKNASLDSTSSSSSSSDEEIE